MSTNVQLLRDVSDTSLRRTIMSCVWLAGVARSASGRGDLVAWMENLAGHCMDERKRRQRAKRYQVAEIESGRAIAISSAHANVWKGRPSTPARDALTAAFFGTGGQS